MDGWIGSMFLCPFVVLFCSIRRESSCCWSVRCFVMCCLREIKLWLIDWTRIGFVDWLWISSFCSSQFVRERESEILWLVDWLIELVDWLGINSMCSSRFVERDQVVVDWLIGLVWLIDWERCRLERCRWERCRFCKDQVSWFFYVLFERDRVVVDGWIGLDWLIGCGSVRSVRVDLFERERARFCGWSIDWLN